jgi:hypothetical protein
MRNKTHGIVKGKVFIAFSFFSVLYINLCIYLFLSSKRITTLALISTVSRVAQKSRRLVLVHSRT